MASLATKPLHCPECSAVVIEASKLTFKQDALVRAALKPSNGTITAIAKDAGMDRSHASLTLRKPTIVNEIALRRQKRLDKARDIHKRLMSDLGADVIAGQLNFQERIQAISATGATIKEGIDDEDSTDPDEHRAAAVRLVRRTMLKMLELDHSTADRLREWLRGESPQPPATVTR